MAQLINELRSIFPPSYFVEVNVLDGLKNNFQAFSGKLDGLTTDHLRKVLRHPGCFYSFNVVGTDEANVSQIELHSNDILRHDFVWITEPAPPRPLAIDRMFVKIGWQPVSYCGVDPTISAVEYVLEMAEGGQYVRGVISDKFAIDTKTEIEYKEIARGSDILSVELNNLKPVTWYHFRLVIEFQGNSVCSEKLSIVSSENVPDAPAVPRGYSRKFKDYLSKDRLCEISWTPPCMNGSKLIKYHVQVCDILIPDIAVKSPLRTIIPVESCAKPRALTTSPVTKTRLNSAMWKSFLDTPPPPASAPAQLPATDVITESTAGDVNGTQPQLETSFASESNLAGKSAVTSDKKNTWETVYFNKVPHTTIAISPKAQEVLVRVRVKSNMGWSKFSDILSINARSHPSLFPQVFAASKSTSSLTAISSSPSPSFAHVRGAGSPGELSPSLADASRTRPSTVLSTILSRSFSPDSRRRSDAMVRAVSRGIASPMSKLTPMPQGSRQLAPMSPERASTTGSTQRIQRLEPLNAKRGPGGAFVTRMQFSPPGGANASGSTSSPNQLINDGIDGGPQTTQKNDLFYDSGDDISDTMSLELPTADDQLWDVFCYAAWEDCSCPLCAEKKQRSQV